MGGFSAQPFVPDPARPSTIDNGLRRTISMRISALPALGLLFFATALFAFPRGGPHGGKPEPHTVLPLAANLQRDLAIHNGLIKDALPPDAARVHIKVLKLESDVVMVAFENLGTVPLKLQLFQVMHDGRYSYASSCPLLPGRISYEQWTEAFDAIGFGAARELTGEEPTVCD